MRHACRIDILAPGLSRSFVTTLLLVCPQHRVPCILLQQLTRDETFVLSRVEAGGCESLGAGNVTVFKRGEGTTLHLAQPRCVKLDEFLLRRRETAGCWFGHRWCCFSERDRLRWIVSTAARQERDATEGRREPTRRKVPHEPPIGELRRALSEGAQDPSDWGELQTTARTSVPSRMNRMR